MYACYYLVLLPLQLAFPPTGALLLSACGKADVSCPPLVGLTELPSFVVFVVFFTCPIFLHFFLLVCLLLVSRASVGQVVEVW